LKVNISDFRKKPVMGILRGAPLELIAPLVEAAICAGLSTLEITMNTPGAPELLRKAGKVAGKRLSLGAGTVLNLQELEAALDSGAGFIVMPVVVEEVVAYCVKNKIPVFPGALSPQEIYRAYAAGATMVKVFPAKCFGPEYFREIKGPFNKIELLACGGVSAENLKHYFACGASAVTFGASIFRQDWLAAKNFKAIESEIKKFIDAWESCRDIRWK
jgi:2-dehydro-3-deoxyphosphogluconate aldolase / (4S)-4-hydroxy-2-oxoglutarate aldolase